MLEIHYSQINIYRTCPRMFKYRNIDLLVPKTESTKLIVGRAVHAAIAAYYLRKDPIQAYGESVTQMLDVIPETEDTLNQLQLGKELVNEYIKFAQANDTFNVYQQIVERSFAVPINVPDEKGVVVDQLYGKHVGTFDAIVEDIHGNLWVLEHKTCSNFPSEIETEMHEQGTLYVLAATQVFDKPVMGVIFNYIRKVHPKKSKTPIIERRWVTKNEHQLYSAAVRLVNIYNRILSDRTFDPNPGRHCSWMCAYTTLCRAEESGMDTEYLKRELYEIKPVELIAEEAA